MLWFTRINKTVMFLRFCQPEVTEWETDTESAIRKNPHREKEKANLLTENYKARFVAKSYSQGSESDYEGTFSPTLNNQKNMKYGQKQMESLYVNYISHSMVSKREYYVEQISYQKWCQTLSCRLLCVDERKTWWKGNPDQLDWLSNHCSQQWSCTKIQYNTNLTVVLKELGKLKHFLGIDFE